jgi:predicted O-methyltransferase YrrM
MVVVGIPSWFQRWRSGKDIVRVTQDDSWESEDMYGRYSDMVDRNLRLYSGLISLPPRLDYMTRMLEILQREPLKTGHDGRVDKSEQGCVAAAFSGIGVEPIPLAEFPFARAFQGHLDYGRRQVKGEPWGYHFGNAFRLNNPHFHRLVKEGRIFWQETEPDLVQRFTWLRDYGQWGREGWSSIHPEFVKKLSEISRRYSRKRVLELGTSRGFLSAIMAENGCVLTTVDRLDRGARRNLEGMNAELVTGSALEFLRESSESFSFIVVDIHGNDLKTWKELWPLLVAHLDPGGRMFLHNSHLWMIPEWFDQTGLRWVLETQLEGWATEILPTPAPGLCLVTKPTL